MTTKFDIGDSVYVVYRNRVCIVEIVRIVITSDEGIRYTFKDPVVFDNEVTNGERCFFATKDELLKSL